MLSIIGGDRVRIYVSGALAASASLCDARAKYEQVAALLRGHQCDVYLPHNFTDPEYGAGASPRKVFERDVQALFSCDVVLAFLDEPSLGVGAEIALALERGVTVFGVWQRGRQVSRFVTGLLESANRGRTAEYVLLEDIVALVTTTAEDNIAGRL
jgi:nucleoside 2-deoxyribosyltransferase